MRIFARFRASQNRDDARYTCSQPRSARCNRCEICLSVDALQHPYLHGANVIILSPPFSRSPACSTWAPVKWKQPRGIQKVAENPTSVRTSLWGTATVAK